MSTGDTTKAHEAAVISAFARYARKLAHHVGAASERGGERVNALQAKLVEVGGGVPPDAHRAREALDEAMSASQYQDILRQELEAVVASLEEIARELEGTSHGDDVEALLEAAAPRLDIDAASVSEEEAGPAIELF